MPRAGWDSTLVDGTVFTVASTAPDKLSCSPTKLAPSSADIDCPRVCSGNDAGDSREAASRMLGGHLRAAPGAGRTIGDAVTPGGE